MGQISFTRAAELDLIDIYLFGVAEFGTRQADHYAAEMAAKLVFCLFSIPTTGPRLPSGGRSPEVLRALWLRSP